jgi:solute carrier family 35 protein E3
MSSAKEFVQLGSSLLLNVVSSVGVIFINKRLVFMAAGFSFGTTLTIIHFVVTFVGCLGFAAIKYYEPKRLEVTRVISICFAFCGYVAFNNMSLLTNSVGVYQISKIVCTPVIVGLEWFVYGQRQSKQTLLSLLPVCVGVFVTVYSDSSVNLKGTFWAILAIVANSFYTIWGKTKQRELGVTPMQILTYQAPISALMLVFLMPFIDNYNDLAAWKPTSVGLTYIALSCIFAFGVNFSFFLFVGQTSALTMNVVGHLKTCLVFLGGFTFFDTVPTIQNVSGIAITLLGLVLYSKAKMAPLPPKTPTDTASRSV